MRLKPYKLPLWNCCFLLVFLCIGCNQKPLQNADSTQKTGGGDGQEQASKPPFIVSLIQDKPTPAIVSGLGAIYLNATKDKGDPHLNVWNLTSNESEKTAFSASVNGPASQSVKFNEDPDTNQYGLYFGDFQTKTHVSVCGTKECKSQFIQLDMLVIKSDPAKFQKLFSSAQKLQSDKIPTMQWNLYFMDPKLEKFQNEQASKLMVNADAKESPYSLEWNGTFNNSETASVKSFDQAPFQLKWVKIKDREILVGTYETDGATYPVIGTKLLTLIKN